FIDAYQRGLNSMQAAWAVKKYRGHRVLSESIMQTIAHSSHPLYLLTLFGSLGTSADLSNCSVTLGHTT
ncbi:hypothetical protein BDR03DRAFT_878010, partial [Suillus americanus]